MSHSTPHDEYRTRRWFFIGVEVVLALSWCGLFSRSDVLSQVCFWALGISIAMLLFVLPWFWSTLRHVAVIGWTMAAASALYLLLYAPAHH
jgi:FtsH-binding integral membrane protein